MAAISNTWDNLTSLDSRWYNMKIEEAIVYVLAERNGGLKTEQIAEIINRRKLYVRKDGQPVTSAQVYAVVETPNETPKKKEPEFKVEIDNKYKS